MEALFGNVINIQWQQVVMWAIGALLIYLAIKKQMEPSLLLPIGFGTILVNLPLSGAVTQVYETGTEEASWTCCSMPALPTRCSRCCCSSASAR